MHPKYALQAAHYRSALTAYHTTVRQLPGIQPTGALEALVLQIVDSVRKVDRLRRIGDQIPSRERSVPSSPMFDPERAAVAAARRGDIEEACWLCFLSVHFGWHGKDKWRLVARVYGGLGGKPFWTWQRASRAPETFKPWLEGVLRGSNAPLGRFGNHRSRETLRPDVSGGTPAVVESYIRWVAESGSHEALLEQARSYAPGEAGEAFDHLYKSMRAVTRFGRLARFDYLTLLGKLRIAAIEPASTYIAEGTGPLRGARLLFGGAVDSPVGKADAERWADELARRLGIGMQPMEDSLCNWQKSPSRFTAFRG